MDNVVTSTWVLFDAKAVFAEYIGGYQDYLIQRPNERVVDQKGDVKKLRLKQKLEKCSSNERKKVKLLQKISMELAITGRN